MSKTEIRNPFPNGVQCSKGFGHDPASAPIERLGQVVLALRLLAYNEVAQAHGHVGMVGAVSRFGHIQGLSGHVHRPVILACAVKFPRFYSEGLSSGARGLRGRGARGQDTQERDYR